MVKQIIIALSLTACITLTGCESTYYDAMESVAGIHKRDILVDRVSDTRNAQKDSQEQFKSALEQLSTIINFNGGKLQDVYEAMQDEYDASVSAAEKVTSRIGKVESVANALFDEWREELEQYSSAKMRKDSEKKLKQTERKFTKLLRSMRQAERKMEPVLTALKDNTLYLKHNLNAQAIGAIKGEYDRIKADVNALINDMNIAIKESDTFIAEMEKQ